MLRQRIKKIIGERIEWPNRKVFVVECLSDDNTTHEATITPVEKDIFLYLLNLKSKLNTKELDKLKDLFDEYKSETYTIAYEEGESDTTYEKSLE